MKTSTVLTLPLPILLLVSALSRPSQGTFPGKTRYYVWQLSHQERVPPIPQLCRPCSSLLLPHDRLTTLTIFRDYKTRLGLGRSLVELIFAAALMDIDFSRAWRKRIKFVYSFMMLVSSILDLLLIRDDGKCWVGDACLVGVAFASVVWSIIM